MAIVHVHHAYAVLVDRVAALDNSLDWHPVGAAGLLLLVVESSLRTARVDEAACRRLLALRV